MNDLTTKIKQLIESEKSINSDIQFLTPQHANLINQILSNYHLNTSLEALPSAEMIYLGAPTGAGKDTLVRKIIIDNSDKNYVVLNMDIFRHYHNEILFSNKRISDIDFAKQTNQTSYELYYIIQEIILREFPGTNVIVTGTMRDIEWVKEIIERYKKDTKTNYNTRLVTLAVPTRESSFSIFERYLSMVDTRNGKNTPLRYTDLKYHDDTIQKFISSVHYFEDNLHSNTESFFDSIQVYRRNNDIFDFSEDTLVYDSRTPTPNKCAFTHIHEIMTAPYNIDPKRVVKLLEIIKSNSSYLKQQNLYTSIIIDLESILPQWQAPSTDISK